MRLDLPLPPPPPWKGDQRPLVDTVDYSIQTAGYFIETPVQDTPGSEKDKKTFMFSNLFIYSPLFIKECRILDWICLGVKVR